MVFMRDCRDFKVKIFGGLYLEASEKKARWSKNNMTWTVVYEKLKEIFFIFFLFIFIFHAQKHSNQCYSKIFRKLAN
jgi:hypothetical protein